MRVAGWDIGGANLKQATADGRAWSAPFELWRKPNELAPALLALLNQMRHAADAFAVTMTGELADCFASKAEGVDRILSAVEQVAKGRPVLVWSTRGCFMSPAEARMTPLAVAAANWHALATWCGLRENQAMPPVAASSGQYGEFAGLLIDIGSTTTDVIPLYGGRPCAVGLTDGARLQSGELLYTGVRRTPLCAVAPLVRWRDCDTPLAAELFATMHDVYLLLGDAAEDPNDCNTANGRPATVAAAHDRLARMLCCDGSELTLADARALAVQFAARQRQAISECVRRVWRRQQSPCRVVFLSGSGEFLARRVLADVDELAGARRVSLTEHLGTATATAACAYAVAVLAEAIPTGASRPGAH